MTSPISRARLTRSLAFSALAIAGCARAQTAAPVAAVNPIIKTDVKPLTWQPLYEPGSGGAMTDLAVSPHDSRRILLAGDMLGVGLSLDRGDSWLPTYGFKSYEIGSFSWHPTDPKTAWAGTMSGPYLSHDGGANWSEKRVGMGDKEWGRYSAPVEQVLFDPGDAGHLIAIGGSSRNWRADVKNGASWGRIWESRDGGDSWKMLTIIRADGTTTDDATIIGDNILWAQFAPKSSSKLYAIGSRSGFLISEDGGKSWKQSNAGLPPLDSDTGGIWKGILHRATVHPTNPNLLWVGVNNYVPPGQTKRVPGGVYKSIDGGKSWTDSSNGLGKHEDQDPNQASRYKAIAIAPSDPNVLYANDMAWSTGVVYKSTDGGVNWKAVATRANTGESDMSAERGGLFQLESAMPSGLGMVGLEVDPRDANAAYGFATAYISRTLDGGKTWDDATSAKAAGADAWRGRGYAGWVATNFRFNPYKQGESILQAMDSAKVWRSDNGLQSWTSNWENPGPFGGGYDVAWTPSGRLYATSGQYSFGGIGRSLDAGVTWENLAGEKFGLPARGAGDKARGIYAVPADPMRVWTTIGGKLYGSADGGDSWKIVLDKADLTWLAGDPKTPTRFYVSGADGVYQSDNGANFTLIGGPKLSGRVAVDILGRVYVASFKSTSNPQAGLWRYNPTDKSWVRLRDDNMISGVAVDPNDPNRVAIGTSDQPYHDETRASGVWLSDDAGQSWHQQNEGLPMLRGAVVAFDPFDSTRLIVGTEGRGFWQTRWPKTRFAGAPVAGAPVAGAPVAGAPVAGAPVAGAPVAGVNLIINGDMEAGETAPANWKNDWTGQGSITIARDSDVVHAGKAAMRVDAKDAQALVVQFVDAKPGESFKVSAAVKTAGEVKLSFDVSPRNNEWVKVGDSFQVGYLQDDAKAWVPIERTVTMPAETARFAVAIYVAGTGSVWVDDVKVEKVNAAK